MADDLIHCPSCNFQLRLPPDLYGREVECPQCHTRFTAPVPRAAPAGDRPPPGREYDAGGRPPTVDFAEPVVAPPSGGAVTAPAVALLVTSLLSVLFFGYMLFGFLELSRNPAEFDRMMQEAFKQNPHLQGEQKEQARKGMLMARDYGAPVCGLFLGLNLLTALGAVMMLARRGYALAVLGCVLALNPVNAPCCVLQVPFGIWGLIALMGESGRRSFR